MSSTDDDTDDDNDNNEVHISDNNGYDKYIFINDYDNNKDHDDNKDHDNEL